MLKEESELLPATVRRERMLAEIVRREFVRVAELADTFGISDVTVRADLAALETSHAVRRVRGGVMAPSRIALAELPIEQSQVELAGEKQRIGERVAALVESGASVLLDVGSTTTAVARALAAREDLEQVTVITNGLTIALELEAAIPRVTVVMTGGTLRRLQHSLVNPMATDLLGNVHADMAVIGCNGIDPERGVTNLNLPEAEVKRRMVAAADRTVVVADGSKLGQAHLGRVAGIDEIDLVVTGPSAAPTELARLRGAGVPVEQVA